MASVFVSNIGLYSGTDFAQTFVLEDSQSNTLMDLTGYTGCAELKKYDSPQSMEEAAKSIKANRAKDARIAELE